MAMTQPTAKQRLLAAIDELPDDALAEVASFAEYQRSKAGEGRFPEPEADDTPLYRAVKVGGLWKGIHISDEDIAEVRREMWDGFGDRDL